MGARLACTLLLGCQEGTTHGIHDVDPLLSPALDELPTDEVLGVASCRAGTLPLLRDLLGPRFCGWAEAAECGPGGRASRQRAHAKLGWAGKLGKRHGAMSEAEIQKMKAGYAL